VHLESRMTSILLEVIGAVPSEKFDYRANNIARISAA
jgi:hypothetical protein